MAVISRPLASTTALEALRAPYKAQGGGAMDPSGLHVEAQTMGAPSTPDMGGMARPPMPSGPAPSGVSVGQQTSTLPQGGSPQGPIPPGLLQGSVIPKPNFDPPPSLLGGGGGPDAAAGVQPGGRGVNLRPLGNRNYPQESASLAQLRKIY